MRDCGQIHSSVLVCVFLIVNLNVLKFCLLFETGHGIKSRHDGFPRGEYSVGGGWQSLTGRWFFF